GFGLRLDFAELVSTPARLARHRRKDARRDVERRGAARGPVVGRGRGGVERNRSRLAVVAGPGLVLADLRKADGRIRSEDVVAGRAVVLVRTENTRRSQQRDEPAAFEEPPQAEKLDRKGA